MDSEFPGGVLFLKQSEQLYHWSVAIFESKVFIDYPLLFDNQVKCQMSSYLNKKTIKKYSGRLHKYAIAPGYPVVGFIHCKKCLRA